MDLARAPRPAGRGALLLVLTAVLVALGATPATAQPVPTSGVPAEPVRQAAGSPEQQLAETYAPVVRLQAQEEECGPGEPYDPVDVDVVLDDPEVAFRGPWDKVNLVGVAPTADDLSAGLPGYHLDFPGHALKPGCAYEEWERRTAADHEPATYARVVGQPDRPDRLALQYWFFYVFNDYNNTHEGDWEMIQLVFETGDPVRALADGPTEVGYSQHSGAERAVWGGEKLERVDGTHPVVYPGAGSHANYFSPAIYLGRSGEQGVGCDDTTGPHRELRPRVAFVPTAPSAYLAAYPWLGFDGHWGELQDAFFDGPTGPNVKERWTRPLTWTEQDWRDDAFAVPLGAQVLGEQSATDFFCGAVAAGSDLLRRTLADSTPVVVGLAVLAALVALAASRTRWSPADPLPLESHRSWGQMLAAARRAYARRPLLLLGIGSVYVVLMLLASGVQWLLFTVTGLEDLRDVAGDTQGYVVAVVLLIGAGFSLLAYLVVIAATAWSLAEADEGREVTARAALRDVVGHRGALAGAAVVVVALVSLLNLLFVTVPLAAYVLVRRQFFVQAVVVEGRGVRGALSRSRDLVRGRWWHTALVSGLVVGVGGLLGPVVGVGLLFVTHVSFGVVNLVSGVVYAVTIPYVALVLTYLYADLRARATLAVETREPT